MSLLTTPSPTEPVSISVVVVAHNEEAKIGACMASLMSQTTDDIKVELILVDDGSTDKTVELAKQAAPRVRVVSNPSKSISSNRNRGMRAASHEYIAYIDADCVAPPDWLKTLAKAMLRLQTETAAQPLAAVGGGNIPPQGETWFYDALGMLLNTRLGSRGSVQGMVFDHTKQVNHLPGLNVLYDKRALEKVEGWNERFARIGEDEDLSRRLSKAGFYLFYVPNAVVTHRQRSTIKSWAKNMFTYGKGRTWLMRHHPEAFELGLLIPPLLPVLLWAYLPAIVCVSVVLAAKEKRPKLAGALALLYATTHVSYGIGQWVGLFTTQDGDLDASARN